MWVSGHMYLVPILVLVARMMIYEKENLPRGSSKQLLDRVRE